MHYNSSTRKERDMKIGDKVWVIVQDSVEGYEGNIIALPEVPQHGQIVAIEEVHMVGCCVLLDNDFLYISPSDIFPSEEMAWVEWERRMKNKCVEIEKITENIIYKRFPLIDQLGIPW